METRNFNTIVVTTDFSDLSTAAINYCRSFEPFAAATLHLVHVLEESRIAALPAGTIPTETLLRHHEEDAETEFAEYIRTVVPQELSVDAVIRHGDPAREIVAFAEEISADLIVIATHGRTGLSHMLMGSVAERVIRTSSVPVLTIKPPAVRDGLLEDGDVAEQLHFEGGK